MIGGLHPHWAWAWVTCACAFAATVARVARISGMCIVSGDRLDKHSRSVPVSVEDWSATHAVP
eukprot:12570926-Prorocentrum_lima.AAC.1